MRKVLKAIDTVNGWMGEAVKWFVVAAILFTCLEVLQRYAFNSPTMWGYEMPIMIGGAMYALSWGYVLLHKGHVRVDIFYAKFSDRTKAAVDVACFVCLFLPVISYLTYKSYMWMAYAWRIGEKSVFTYWYPPISPLRTLIFVGVALLLLQGLAQFWRDVYMLAKGERYD
ncbi:MAG: TRAP transporter small permease subunit [Dehalococcoidia bacterium]|nr:MAG: TRAP transporter small permease subunit [Dehalococcoidia bacterium]